MKDKTRLHQLGEDAQHERNNGYEIKLCNVIT